MASEKQRLRDGRELCIRQAVPGDAENILEHVGIVTSETTFLAWEPGEFSMTVEEEARVLQQFHDADNKLFLLAIIDGEIVGNLTFSGGNRRRFLHRGEFGMAVIRREWGNGIGSFLVDTLIDWAREGGVVAKINLRVRTDNERGFALYERKGFVLEGTVARDIRIDGVDYDLNLMGLQL